MRGDVLNSIRWSEVNNCTSFQSGDKRKVKLYGKVVEDLEFDNELEAEGWLLKYYVDKKNERLNRLKDGFKS